jgi:hypothetical protein
MLSVTIKSIMQNFMVLGKELRGKEIRLHLDICGISL